MSITSSKYHLVACSFCLVASLATLPAIAEDRKVDCGNSQSLQKVIDQAHIGDTVSITGVCEEQITIRKDHLRLVGMDGATIDGGTDGSEGNSVVRVRALNVTLVGLTITGGRSGIVVSHGGSAVIGENSPGMGNTIDSVGRYGIVVSDSGYAQIDNNIIRDVGRFGIFVTGAAADLENNDVRRSDRHGMFVSTARVNLEAPNTFLNNGQSAAESGWGILCNQLGALRVQADQILANGSEDNKNGTFLNSGGSCSVSTSGGVTFP